MIAGDTAQADSVQALAEQAGRGPQGQFDRYIVRVGQESAHDRLHVDFLTLFA
ncbi:hypothetical protein D3C77_775290 [compost metagenome]